MLYTIFASLLIFASCYAESPSQIEYLPGPDYIHFTTEGHDYILFYSKTFSSIVHNPECKKCNNYLQYDGDQIYSLFGLN